jgi:hypothetical protein
VLSADDARRLALSMPGAVEQDHHGRPSFRVDGNIFATLWSENEMNVMASEPRIRMAVADDPDVCSEVMWGRKLSAVRVKLDVASEELLEDLVGEAWAQRAPKQQ